MRAVAALYREGPSGEGQASDRALAEARRRNMKTDAMLYFLPDSSLMPLM